MGLLGGLCLELSSMVCVYDQFRWFVFGIIFGGLCLGLFSMELLDGLCLGLVSIELLYGFVKRV